MQVRESARSVLRAATAAHHDRVDHLFSRLDLSDAGDYSRFLQAQASAHLPVERALTLAGADDVVSDWSERQRADALRADLIDLGLAQPYASAAIAFEGHEAVLGGIYVLEGSRLGGKLLKRQVSPHLPTRFLSDGDSAAWRRLLATLEERLVTDEQRAGAAAGAIAVFHLFETAAASLAHA
jgi:heme oxygenase